MNCRTITELQVGDKATRTRMITAADIHAFAGVSHDLNPVHVDPTFAKGSIFKQQVAHGMLTASMISAMLANDLPGVGTIYLSQTLKFTAPVFIADTITAELEVTEIDREKGRVTLLATLKNQDGKVVLTGESRVIGPKEKPQVA